MSRDIAMTIARNRLNELRTRSFAELSQLTGSTLAEEVKGPDGKVTTWGIEGGPPTNLFRNGITKTTLPIGTEIKVFAYQAKSGESKCVGVFVEYLDGRKVFMGGSAPGANGQAPTPGK